VLIWSARLGATVPLDEFPPTEATRALQVPLMTSDSDLRNGSNPASRDPLVTC